MGIKYQSIALEKGDVLGGLRGLLGRVLESGLAAAVLVPRRLPSGDGFVQSLIRDPAMLAEADPVAPTMAVQSARILGELTSSAPVSGGPTTTGPSSGGPAAAGGPAATGLATGGPAGRIAAVLKPCELRAAVELAKFQQVDLQGVLTVGIDCPGTYEVRDYAELARDGGGRRKGTPFPQPPEGYSLRPSCRICETPAPEGADIALGILGSDRSGRIELAVAERFQEEAAERLGLELSGEASAERARAVEELASRRRKERASVLGELRAKAQGLDRLMELLSTCIRCHNCMNACPICYCKECVFRSTVFEHNGGQLLRLAARKGALRLPADTLLFHLTRMSHMASSCTGCGMCTSACPSRLPVAELFALVSGEVQEMFGYAPGRTLEEEPPVSVFKEEELAAETGSG